MDLNERYVLKIAGELKVADRQVAATALLFEEGATVPFIARYRKELTGSLDEVAVTTIRDRLAQLQQLDERRESILKTIEQQGKLTDELRDKILAAETLAVLEDLYLPYKPKRRTRATLAKERGLEPLARMVFEQRPDLDPEAEAAAFVNPEKGVESIEAALAGARDIIAEQASEDQQARSRIRELFFVHGQYESKVIEGKETEGVKYKDYFDWQEAVKSAPSHRVLAMRRGEKEGFLRMRVTVSEPDALALLEQLFVKGSCPSSQQVKEAVADGYKRLLSSSIETEVRLEGKKLADQTAIRVFAENLRELLLASPLGGKNMLALDPGFRTGCKVACLDRQGKLVYDDVVYPFQSEAKAVADAQKLKVLCDKFEIEAIAIGNGTASRETEAYVRKIPLSREVPVVMVNESGASIYSASEVAREEFPDKDVTVRGAVSIGRRLMDPLAELVKIDPKSIGVGQYQHDVDQGQLKQGLDDVVVSCVNSVGVEVNTASKQLLMYVSGLGPQLAQNIVEYRNEHGPFGSRGDLMEVPRLGAKAFEQAAGFLRIRGATNPLDASAVHPESYPIVDRMATDAGCSVADLMADDALRKKIRLENYLTENVGLPTLNDILQELAKPGRDPRRQFEAFEFSKDVSSIEHVQPGMRLPGIVTNVTAFGAFVDIGVHQDGLVHISELADRFVKDPSEVVKVHQKVFATVLAVDLERKRISLSLKTGTTSKPQPQEQPKHDKPGRPGPKPSGPRPANARPANTNPPRRGPDEPFGERLNIRLN
jgi:protein Tex